jgi:hypothetical protein
MSDIWYELRVEGSVGTQTGIVRNATEGIAIADSGRLCSIASGETKCFGSKQEAMHYLFNSTIPGNYRFEVVACNAAEMPRKSSETG